MLRGGPRLAMEVRVVRRLVKAFGGRMALDCAVTDGGRIAVADPVALL